MKPIEEALQSLELSPRVELFKITNLKNEVIRLTSSLREEPIVWNGNTYLSFPITITGVGYAQDNLSETPKVSLINIADTFTATFSTIGAINLKGYSLEYIVTFEDYIGTDINNDSSLFFLKAHFTFSQQLSKTIKQITWQLDPLLTYNNKKMPFRQILRDGELNLRFEGVGLRKQLK